MLKNNKVFYDFFLKNQTYSLDDYTITPLRFQDITLIRKWRNSQIIVLRQKKPLTVKQQLSYFKTVIKKSFNSKKPEVILFSFILNKSCIGYGGFVHIDWEYQRAEVSFVLDTERTKHEKIYRKEFSIFLKILLDIAFEEIKFNKLTTETFDIRPITLDILNKNKFKLEGRLKKHVKIENHFYDSLLHGILRANYIRYNKITNS